MLELFIRRRRPKWTLRCIAGLGGAGRERPQGERQSVTIRPQGGIDVTAVLIALRK